MTTLKVFRAGPARFASAPLMIEFCTRTLIWFGAFAAASIFASYWNQWARADESDAAVALLLAAPHRVSGVGLEMGRNDEGTLNGGLVIRSHTVQDSEQFRGAIGSGSGELRLGRGVGIAARNNSGTNLITAIHPAARDLPVIPIAGAHLFPLDFELNTNSDDVREDYIEWMPHLSGGLAVPLRDICGITARIKAGASIGTLGEENGAGSMRGVALEVECDDRFMLSGDRSVIDRDGTRATLSRVDLALPLGEHLTLGVYAARVRTENNQESGFFGLDTEGVALRRDEARAGITMGGAF